MGEYMPAAVCTRGHTITQDTTVGEGAKRCPDCGGPVLVGCPACNTRIRGYYYVEGVVGGGWDYEPPKFCDQCGAPFPWVGRQERLYEFENLMEQEPGLDEATKLWLRERLAALRQVDAMDDKAQRQAWQEIKDHAQALWENPMAQKVLDTLLTQAVQRALR
jgi:hypothetical protein